MSTPPTPHSAISVFDVDVSTIFSLMFCLGMFHALAKAFADQLLALLPQRLLHAADRERKAAHLRIGQGIETTSATWQSSPSQRPPTAPASATQAAQTDVAAPWGMLFQLKGAAPLGWLALISINLSLTSGAQYRPSSELDTPGCTAVARTPCAFSRRSRLDCKQHVSGLLERP